MNKISFVVPVYNNQDYIDICLRSLQSQTVDNMEIILVDDGSTDNSGMICDQYAAEDNRFIVIHQQNSGIAVARNVGQAAATGEWIGFVDSDDWIEQDYVEKLLPYMDQEYELIFFQYDERSVKYTKAYRSTKDIQILDRKSFELLEQDSIDTGIGNRMPLLKSYRGQVWTKIYKKDFLDKYSLSAKPKLRRSQDVMFSLEVYHYAVKGIMIPEVLYHYRITDNSISHQYNENQIPRITCLMDEMGEYLKRIGKMEMYHDLYEMRIAITLAQFCIQDFCHPYNPQKYGVRKKRFLAKRTEAPFFSVYCRLHSKNYGFPKGILVFCIKHKLFLALTLMNYIRKTKQ